MAFVKINDAYVQTTFIVWFRNALITGEARVPGLQVLVVESGETHKVEDCIHEIPGLDIGDFRVMLREAKKQEQLENIEISEAIHAEKAKVKHEVFLHEKEQLKRTVVKHALPADTQGWKPE